MQNAEQKSSGAAKPRIDQIDLLKGIGICMVVAIHAPLLSGDFMAIPSASRVMQYVLRLAIEGVPLFMLVNGYLMLGRETISLCRHFRRMGQLVLLLLAWATLLSCAGQLVSGGLAKFAVTQVISDVLNTGLNSRFTGVLWFVQYLLSVYLLYPALFALYQRKDRAFDWLAGAIGFFVAGIGLLNMAVQAASASMDVTLLKQAIAFVGKPMPLNPANAWYVFCFMLGGILRREQAAIRARRVRWIVVGVICWALAAGCGIGMSFLQDKLYSEAFNYSSVFQIGMLVGLFALTVTYRCRGTVPERFLLSLGRNSFGIYVIHTALISALHKLLPMDGTSRLLIWVSALLASWLLTLLIGRIPILKKLVML